MDMTWVIRENIDLATQGRLCPRAAVANILNGVVMDETQTIADYTLAKQAVREICKDDENLSNVVCKMLDSIITDETSHQMSAQKAANLCQGVEQPKSGEEFKKAVRGNDVETI